MPATIAFVPVCSGQKFGIGAAEKDMPGYWPMLAHGEFDTWEQARARADELNAERGVTPVEAMAIVCSSMKGGK